MKLDESAHQFSFGFVLNYVIVYSTLYKNDSAIITIVGTHLISHFSATVACSGCFMSVSFLSNKNNNTLNGLALVVQNRLLHASV
jgi:hypothetical protein